MKQGRLSLFRWSCGFAAGVSLFFTFGVARTLFDVFPRETAGAINQHLFIPYFATLLVIWAVAALAAFPVPKPNKRNMGAFLLIVAAICCVLIIGFVIAPQLQAHPAHESRETFRWLHGISMILNLLSIIFTIGAPLCAVSPASKINRASPTP